MPDGATAGELLRALASAREERGCGAEVGQRFTGACELCAAARRRCDPSSDGEPIPVVRSVFIFASFIRPSGHLDINGQQIDLRTTNSWLLKLRDVSIPELVEVMAINALAPFLLNSRLQPLMASTQGNKYVVNVSAMEGKFYRHKTPNHPHTNMAKAALNMMTRTSAKDLAEKDGIYMTAVDTGWINDENPRDKAARIAEASHFQTPIDEVDAAARVLHPVFHGVSTKEPLYGVFLKDFIATEW